MWRKLEKITTYRGKIGKNLVKFVKILCDLYLIYVFFQKIIIFFVENGINKAKNRG